MKKYLDEKGSLPLILLMVFIITMSIISLSNLLMTEKVNTKLSLMGDINKMYEKDSVIELTKNVVEQQILSKKWEEVAGEEVFGDPDLSIIEETLNQEVFPNLGIESQIYLEGIFFPPSLDYYCQAVSDEEGDFLIYDCMEEGVSLELKLTISKEGQSSEFNIKVDEFTLLVNEQGNVIHTAPSK